MAKPGPQTLQTKEDLRLGVGGRSGPALKDHEGPGFAVPSRSLPFTALGPPSCLAPTQSPLSLDTRDQLRPLLSIHGHPASVGSPVPGASSRPPGPAQGGALAHFLPKDARMCGLALNHGYRLRSWCFIQTPEISLHFYRERRSLLWVSPHENSDPLHLSSGVFPLSSANGNLALGAAQRPPFSRLPHAFPRPEVLRAGSTRLTSNSQQKV